MMLINGFQFSRRLIATVLKSCDVFPLTWEHCKIFSLSAMVIVLGIEICSIILINLTIEVFRINQCLIEILQSCSGLAIFQILKDAGDSFSDERGSFICDYIIDSRVVVLKA